MQCTVSLTPKLKAHLAPLRSNWLIESCWGLRIQHGAKNFAFLEIAFICIQSIQYSQVVIELFAFQWQVEVLSRKNLRCWTKTFDRLPGIQSRSRYVSTTTTTSGPSSRPLTNVNWSQDTLQQLTANQKTSCSNNNRRPPIRERLTLTTTDGHQ